MAYDERTQQLCVAGAIFTICVVVYTLLTYRRYRSQLESLWNHFALLSCAVQLLQAVNKLVSASSALASQAVITGWGCNINATIDQFLDVTSATYLAIFFLLLMNDGHLYDRAATLKLLYASGVVCGAVTTAVMWLCVTIDQNHAEYGETYFSMRLGWCWIPGHRQDGLSVLGVDLLRFFCSYFFPLVMVVFACSAYLRKRYVTASGSFSWHLKRVIVARFVLLCLFPAITYSLGFASRFSRDDRLTFDRTASFLLTAVGGLNSLVLLGTEKALLALMRGDGALSPNGFSGVVKNLACHTVSGVPAEHFLETDSLLASASDMHSVVVNQKSGVAMPLRQGLPAVILSRSTTPHSPSFATESGAR
jgi:hypothetical protein